MMNKEKKFLVDKQTLEDLNVLGKYRQGSVYSIFNQTKTRGGEQLMQQWFKNPLQDVDEINSRSAVLTYFQHLNLTFPFDATLFGSAENYLESGGSANYLFGVADLGRKKMKKVLFRDEQFQQIYEGLWATISFLKECKVFLKATHGLRDASGKVEFEREREVLAKTFADPRLKWLASQRGAELSFFEVCKYDYLLRYTMSAEMEALLEIIYHLDVYIAIGKVAMQRGFACGEALAAEETSFEASALWHPALLNGVPNELFFKRDENLLFLTGANMAGKSTLMKAFGIVVYLAHMGFPVSAKNLRFSVMQGLYSSINVSDDLNSGYSHFYAEVLRVKTVAEQVSKGQRLVVLFDELFKGTNVKDAFEATLAVTRAFSEYEKCFFVISTHIIEVGEHLSDTKQVRAAYLPTFMNGNSPKYTYQLEQGITADRQGMLIIQNEGILDMLQRL